MIRIAASVNPPARSCKSFTRPRHAASDDPVSTARRVLHSCASRAPGRREAEIEGNLDTEGLFRAVIDAIPSPLFVVDEDVRIISCNDAAHALLEGSPSPLRMRAGDALGCLHSFEVPEGCGRAEACKTCVVRTAVGESCRARKVLRRREKMTLSTGGVTREINVLVTTSPIDTAGGRFVLLLLEDIGELMELRTLLPICMHCGKVRDGERYWSNVDTYFKKHLDLDFTHGLCDDCLRRHYPELR